MDDDTPQVDSPDERLDWEALGRYLAGESPAKEHAAVHRWLLADPGRRALVFRLDRSIKRFASKAPAVDVEGAVRRVSARLDSPAIPLRSRRSARAAWPLRLSRATTLRAAAAVAILVGGVAMFRQVAQRPGVAAPVIAAAQTYTTAVGTRDSLRLPDGSRVLLGPGSRLTLAAGYGRSSRQTILNGTAWFDVRHDDARPFSVRVGASVIRDIGTAFTVQSQVRGGARVVVTSGAVLLYQAGSREDRGTILKKGDRGTLEPNGHVVLQRAAATRDDLAWTRGQLTFRDAPLADVGEELRRWYGIELRVADSSLAARPLTASFAGESRAQVLDVVALTLGAEVEMRGDTAILRISRTERR